MYDLLLITLQKINIFFLSIYSKEHNVLLFILSLFLILMIFDLLKNDTAKDFLLNKNEILPTGFRNFRASIYTLILMIIFLFNSIHFFCSLYYPINEINILDAFFNKKIVRGDDFILFEIKDIPFSLNSIVKMTTALSISYILALCVPTKNNGKSTFEEMADGKKIKEKMMILFTSIPFIILNLYIIVPLFYGSFREKELDTKSLESLIFLTVFFFLGKEQSILFSKFKEQNISFYIAMIFILQMLMNIQFFTKNVIGIFPFSIAFLFMLFYLRDRIPIAKPSLLFSFCFFISFLAQIFTAYKSENTEYLITILNTYTAFSLFFYKAYIEDFLKKNFLLKIDGKLQKTEVKNKKKKNKKVFIFLR